jgi:autotransporter-associated beta strand protein
MKASHTPPHHLSRFFRPRVAFPVLLLAFASPLSAQTYTWDNGANTGLWGNSANWVGDPALTFGNTTDVVFDDASVINRGNAVAIGGARTIRSLSIGANYVGTTTATFDIRTYSSIGSGAVNLTFAAASGNASINVAQSTSGAAQVRLGNDDGGNVVLNSSLNLAQSNTFFGVAGLQFDGKISGAGAINKTGLGEVRLVRDNSGWSGGMNINEGNVTIAFNPNAMGSGTWTLGGGATNTSLRVGSSFTYANAGGLTVAAGAGTRTIANYASAAGNPILSGGITLNKDAIFAITNFAGGTHDRLSLSGAVGGTGGIVKTGNGILILSVSNNYSGTTDIQGGKLFLGTAGRLGSGAVTISSGANLDFGTGVLQINIVSNNISGAGQLIQSTASTDTRLTGDVTSTGGLTINNGTLRIGNGGTTGSYTGATVVNSGAVLAFARSDAYTHGGAISGVGGVTKVDAGVVTVTGDNSYSGVTTLFDGTLMADHANALGTGNITFTNGGGNTGTIRYTAASAGTDWASRIKSSTAAIRLDTGGQNVTLAGVIDNSNVNGLVKSGSGTLSLTGNNAFTGGTTVSGGVLQLNRTGGQSLGTTSSVSVGSGATLLISQSDQVSNSAGVTLSGGTIQRASGVSEVFGSLNVTTSSLIDFSGGTGGTIQFTGLSYTPSGALSLQLVNFTAGNTLVITGTSDWTTQIGTGFTFSGSGGFGSSSFSGSTFTITAVPEPSTVASAAGLLGLLSWPVLRRRFGRREVA